MDDFPKWGVPPLPLPTLFLDIWADLGVDPTDLASTCRIDVQSQVQHRWSPLETKIGYGQFHGDCVPPKRSGLGPRGAHPRTLGAARGPPAHPGGRAGPIRATPVLLAWAGEFCWPNNRICWPVWESECAGLGW